jgi:alpha-mannosidase
MQKHRAITLERLELLESGKCYTEADQIAILSQLYSATKEISRIEVLKNTGRISFPQVVDKTPEFQPTKIGESFGPTWDTHWFKLTISIPQSWLSEEIHLRWDSDSEAALWDQNGTLLQVQ